MTAPTKLVARKTVTYIQEGSAYKERFTLPFAPPEGTTVRTIFLDSSGGQIQDELVGTVEGRNVTWREPYEAVAEVPNGALFYVYMNWGGDDETGEDMLFYGSVFRRQNVFPDDPAIASSSVVRKYGDDFQRPQGAVGGRWKVLLGRPYIFDNGGLPNSVGPNYNFFSRYFMFFYRPFNDDSVELSISATQKGPGVSFITLCQNSTASSYLYVAWSSITNPETMHLGYGTSPDIGTILSPNPVFQDQISPVGMDIPSGGAYRTFKIRYDDVTKTLGVYDDDLTEIASWTDDENIVPHGKGYRYFGVGGNSGLFNSGVQVSYIRAAGIV